ncbi:MAG: hypothetical protein ACRENF_03995, partial [Thermodesulfobacteriota bacterium]
PRLAFADSYRHSLESVLSLGRMIMLRGKVTDYSWLLDRRSKIQNLIYKLYIHVAQHRAKITKHKIHRRVCGLMIGATFSLWRAVFLVNVEQRGWGDIFLAGEQFLRKIIETNAIGFSDEFSLHNRTWVVGFYLNNARFRAEKAIEKLLETKSKNAFTRNRQSGDWNPLSEHLKKLKIGIPENKRDAKDLWDETFHAVENVLDLMVAEKRSK